MRLGFDHGETERGQANNHESGRSNRNLNRASANKNDEFYTRFEEIEKEAIHYKPRFKGSVVFCKCDDPMMEHKKRFLIIDNLNAVSYKEIFPLFQNNKIWLGVKERYDMDLIVPPHLIDENYNLDTTKKERPLPVFPW